jgi:hypothetical protein
MSAWRMNRFCVLIFLLGLVFAAQEMPEFFSLSDDTSNDGIIVANAGKTARPDPYQGRPKSAPGRSFSVEITARVSFVSPLMSPAFESSTTVRSDLLHLLSVQRK